MNRIKAVIFDVGGVLAFTGKYLDKPIHHHRSLSVHIYVSKKLKINLDQWFDAIDTTYAKAIEGKISREKTLETISKNLHVDKKKLEKIIIKAYRKYLKPNKKLYKFAFKLKKLGYKIAILSDQWWISKEALIQKKYSKKFNVVVISCDVGMRKPNPKIFKLTLKRLRTKPQETLFIDNQEWNIRPAKKLGIKTLQFHDDDSFFKQVKKFGLM